MKFHLASADVFVPDGLPFEQALQRTTHMAISAHHDDIEIMASAPIIECYQQPDKWFTGVVVSDGRGSPRSGLYENYSNEDMRLVRIKEQHKAAIIGEYAAQVILDYPSKDIKDARNPHPVQDLVLLLKAARPKVVFTHNIADKHDTHVGVALRVITAIRSLPAAGRPQKLFGCEVWRDLDWTVDSDKVPFNLSEHENLQAALLGIYDSQIAGGKRYDLASMGRRRANATYFESHGVDTNTSMTYAIDLTPLVADDSLPVDAYIQSYIQRFAQDVGDRLKRLS